MPNRKGAVRRSMLWLHGWIGITVGAWLAIVGVTGSLLTWRAEAEPRIQARLMRVHPQASRVSVQAVYDTVKHAYPGQKIDRIYPSAAPDRSHEVRLPTSRISVYVDPYSGRILGSQSRLRNFYDTVDELHVRMLSAETGHFLVGLGGVSLLIMSISGVFLWWPRRGQWRRAFVPNLHTNWRGRNYELHRVIGIFVCGLLLTCATTGIALVWSEPAANVLSTFLGKQKKPKVRKAVKGTWLSLDELVARSEAALPGGQNTRITWPKKAGAPLVVRKRLPGELNPAGNCSVSIDPVNGKILKVEDSRQTDAVTHWLNLRYPIHTGLWAGTFSKILYTLAGLSLPAFYVSGLFLWFLKRKQKKKSRLRTSRAA